MPKINLTAEQRAQLIEWIDGGPTDPIGLANWVAANCPNPGTGQRHVLCDQAEGERDLYQKLLDFDGRNVNRSTFANKELASLGWVATSLDNLEALGIAIPEHQQRMRPTWSEVRSL